MENWIEELLRRYHPDLEFDSEPTDWEEHDEDEVSFVPSPDDDPWTFSDEYEEFRRMPAMLKAA